MSQHVPTRVYGASDDLIEFEGAFRGEVGFCATDSEDAACLLVFSDGTLLAVSYGKPQGGIWKIELVAQGSLFAGIDVCLDEDAEPYSDVARFRAGIKWAYAAKEWEQVR